MTDIKVLPKKRKDSSTAGWLRSKEGDVWISPYDYALQSEINENKEKTKARSCFSGCQTCGHCKASRRGCASNFSFDNGHKVYCEGCEKFGFCDCVNGVLRNTRGEAEPFTEEAQKLFKQGGKPLI